MVLAQKQTHELMEEKRVSRNKMVNLWQSSQEYAVGKKISSTYNIEKTRQLHAK